jgi:hypothetical protein
MGPTIQPAVQSTGKRNWCGRQFQIPILLSAEYAIWFSDLNEKPAPLDTKSINLRKVHQYINIFSFQVNKSKKLENLYNFQLN